MTIEKLEALEKAATAGPWAYEPIWWAFRMAEKAGNTHVPDDLAKDAVYPKCDDAVFMAESRNALPALLAVAKAAKLVKAANARRANAQVQDCCVRVDYEQSMGYACDQLTLALERLEAQ